MQPYPGDPAAEKTFRPPLASKIIGAVVLALIAGAIVGVLLPNILPNTVPRAGKATITIAAIAVVVMLIIGGTVMTAVRVIVSPTTVRVVKTGGRNVHSWERSQARFTSHVVKRTTNGIPSGTTRTLVVQTRDGQTQVNLAGMSRATFNTMLAELAPVTVPPVDGSDDPRLRQAVNLPRTFDVNRQAITSTVNSGWIITGGLVLIAVVLAVLGFAVFTEDDDLQTIFLVLGPIAFIGAVISLIITLRAASRARLTPAKLEVTSQAVRVDDVDYGFASMSRLWMTPPAYATRRLRLEAPTGQKRTVLLGGADGKVFDAYEEFIVVVTHAARQYPALIAFDRE